MDWMAYLEMDLNAFHRENYYLAQIACIIAKVFGGKSSKSLKIDDFLLKFKTRKKKRKQVSKEDTIEMQKRRWFARVGLDRKKNK